MQHIDQNSLFPLPSPAATTPSAAAPPPPRQIESAEALLRELTDDWWSMLDPRNWREPGPTNDEILARYRAIGSPDYDAWPIVSGSRMYSRVWPTLRLTYRVPDDALLAACQTCRSRHLSDAHDVLHRSVLDYALAADLIGRQTWNGDEWAPYVAFARFSGQPVASLASLTAAALDLTVHRTIAAYHTALAARFRPVPALRRPSRSRGATADTAPDSEIARLRQTLS